MFENESLTSLPTLFNPTNTSNTISVTVIPHKLPIPLHEDPLYNTFLHPSQIDLIQKAKFDGYINSPNTQPTLFINSAKINFLPQQDSTPQYESIEATLEDFLTIKPNPSKHYYINLDRHNLEHFNNLLNYKTHNPLSYNALFSPCVLHSPVIHSITQSALQSYPDILKETPSKKGSFSMHNPTELNLKRVLNFLQP